VTDASLAGSCVLAVDVGGTSIKGAAVGCNGDVYGSLTVPTARAGPGAVETQVEQVTVALAEAAETRASRPPLAVGLVVPGLIDSKAGIVRSSANIGWADVNMKARIGRIIDVPFALGHDARAAALAEWKLGAAHDVDDFLFVGIGTGIGAAVVADGVLRAGRHGQAGEVGHIRAVPAGQRCGCGAVGCLETIASASAIQRRYCERGGQDGSALSATEVLRWASEGADQIAVGVRDEAVTALASVLITVQRVIDVELVVVGGGLSLAGDSLLVPLAAEMKHRSGDMAAPQLRASAFGAESGFRGAAVMAWRLLGVELSAQGLRAKPG
jgi:glucokinase